MKWKATLVLLIVTAGVFAYLFLVERNSSNTADAARETQNVVNFSREKIDGVVIQNGDDKIGWECYADSSALTSRVEASLSR